jgi:hypothetical protein
LFFVFPSQNHRHTVANRPHQFIHIVDERDIKEATERMQAHLEDQVKPQHPVIVPIIINPALGQKEISA